MELKLEVVLLPVWDVDRAKAFYVDKVGFDLDIDTRPGEGLRVVQMTPPGSACSVAVGTGITDAEPRRLQRSRRQHLGPAGGLRRGSPPG